VTAGAVSDRADPVEVEWGVELGEEIDSGRDVEERPRPAAAVPDAPVLEVPGREAVRREVLAERRHQRAVVTRAPVAAVDHDDDRGPVSARETQLPDLARVLPVPVQ
jgi:hypothetical protein